MKGLTEYSENGCDNIFIACQHYTHAFCQGKVDNNTEDLNQKTKEKKREQKVEMGMLIHIGSIIQLSAGKKKCHATYNSIVSQSPNFSDQLHIFTMHLHR